MITAQAFDLDAMCDNARARVMRHVRAQIAVHQMELAQDAAERRREHRIRYAGHMQWARRHQLALRLVRLPREELMRRIDAAEAATRNEWLSGDTLAGNCLPCPTPLLR